MRPVLSLTSRFHLEMYKDRRSNWINDEIVSRQQDLDHQASQFVYFSLIKNTD